MSWIDKVYGEFEKVDLVISQVVQDDAKLRATIRQLVITVRKLALADGQRVNEYLDAAWRDYQFACQEEGDNFDRIQAALADVEAELGEGLGEDLAEVASAPSPAPQLPFLSVTEASPASDDTPEAEPAKKPAAAVAKKPAAAVAKKPAVKKASAKKTPVTNGRAKKASAKKTPVTNGRAKKASAKKTPVTKVSVKKASAKKPSPAKKASKRPAKKAPIKKAPVKKGKSRGAARSR